MARELIFDNPTSLQIIEARQAAVRSFLAEIRQKWGMKTAVDVGCGVGQFCSFLYDLSFDVLGLDGREENVQEARVRYPNLKFHRANVEDESVLRFGSYDLVFCMGLLYHLENPLLAIRRIRALTKKGLLVESMCIPGEKPWMLLREEPRAENQSLTDVAFYPSESCLVKMLYRAGFGGVYRFAVLPDHDDFRDAPKHFRRRTMLYASPEPISLAGLVPLPEPQEMAEPWQKSPKGMERFLRRAIKFLSLPAKDKYLALARQVRQRFPRIPMALRLPYKAWWVCRNDLMSDFILGGAFEPVESAFVGRFLQPGMTVLDIGAHHGFYTMMASRKVGSEGKVFSFEPSPRERKALLLHRWINRCTNVRVQPFALGGEEGEADFYLVEGSLTGCNSLRPPAIEEKTSALRVFITTLDSWLKKEEIGRVDFIKLDVEGAEFSVLQGATDLLELCPRPVILAEVQDIRTRPWGYEAKEIVRFLGDRDFRWFRLSDGGSLTSLNPDAQNFDGNYVAVPEEKIAFLGGLLSSGQEMVPK